MLICIVAWIAYFVFCSLMIGVRVEHVFFAVLFIVHFFPHAETRKFAMCMLPFILFGATYDVMRLYPNYLVNDVDIQDIYEADKALFGVTVEGTRLSLNEFFQQHTFPAADFLAGFFYLMWVPLPLFFSLYMFFKGDRTVFLHFTWAFLLINWLGFVGYYLHPASPPWFFAANGPYVDSAVLGQQMGSEAGLARFDELLGITFFHDLYARNANVFAAVPSLHSTYCLCTFVYALIGKCRWYITLPAGIVSLGICWTAVYTSHHYVIDVMLGVGLCLTFILLWEKVILRWPLRKLERSYVKYVS